MRRAALGLLLAGCGSSGVFVEPVVDKPDPADVDATAIGLDGFALSVAHAGSEQDIASLSFAPGDSPELADIPFADDLVIHLSGLIGGSEVAYGRTCTFGITARFVPEPHLLFSRVVKFAKLPFEAEPRIGGCAVTYHDGSAVLLGGTSDGAGIANATVERFDPRTGTQAPLPSLMPRIGAVAATLGTGSTARIAVIGGQLGASGAGIVELIEADNDRVDSIQDTELAMARIELTATALTDGRIVVIGGRPPGAGPVAPSGAIAEITDDASMPDIRELRTTALAHARAGHTATRLGDDVGAPVLIVGGLDATNKPVAEAELFRPLSGDIATAFHPAMITARTRHEARLMPDGSVLIIGGLDATGAPVRALERFTIDSGFVPAGELPATAGLVDFTATTLPDGRILLAGGRAAPGAAALDTAFIARLDVVDGTVDVVATDNLAAPRAGHQATVMCDGTVLVAGGTATTSALERYNPPPLGRR